MKAIFQSAYGGLETLALREVERPEVGPKEVLVKVHATSVHPDVWHVMTGLPYVLRLMGAGLLRPKQRIPGTEVAGVVDAVGGEVTRFVPGDEVFGETIGGMQWVNGGAFAEFAAAQEESLVRKPETVPFVQAAAVPTAGLIALQIDGRATAGSNVLVNGAAGGVGSMALQMAKIAGARVTGVDRSDKLDMLLQMGADRVIDYEKEDFTRSSEQYDLIFDIPGNHSLEDCKRALGPNGTYILIGHDQYGHGMRRWFGLVPRMLGLMLRQRSDPHLPEPRATRPTKRESLEKLAAWLSSGALTPHIDRTYPLSEVPEAMQFLMSGCSKGKIVITV